MQKLFSRPIFGAIFVFLISFVIYLQTMAQSVPFIDGGELATVCATLGIAHPTGYPIFCIIGFLFANLPIASTVILRLNIMSAFFVALGSGAMVFFISELYLYWFNKKKEKVQQQQKGKKVVVKPVVIQESITEEKKQESVAAGIFAGLVIAFSATWWDTSSSVEVYPIHCFLVPIVLTFFFRMLRIDKEKFGRESFLFAFLLGLSFSNHLTTVLLAPACLYMFFATYGFRKDSFVRIAKLALPFALGLLPYLYFPIRSSQFPLMDWGHPANWYSFWKHFRGGQYSIMMFTKDAPGRNWPYFWGKYPEEFSILGLGLIVTGLSALFNSSGRGKAHLLPFILLLFFGCLFWSINFDILEINPYFLTAYIASIISMTFGMGWLYRSAKERKKEYLAFIAAVAIIGLQLFTHFKDVDESGNYFVEDYTKNMLRSLPKDAIIFTSSWDFWASGAFYYQLVEKIRPDIFVIDVAMLRDRPWYYNHLKQRFPDVMKRAEPELSAFMVHLVEFDRGEDYGGESIARTYTAFTEAFVSRNLERPIFLSPEVIVQRDPLFAPSFKPMAAGLAYRILPHDSLLDVPLPELQWNDKNYRARSYYTDNSRWFQAMPLADRAQNLVKMGRLGEAKKFLDLAMKLEPDMNADIEKLHGRDHDAAIHINEQFGRLEEFRRSLGK